MLGDQAVLPRPERKKIGHTSLGPSRQNLPVLGFPNILKITTFYRLTLPSFSLETKIENTDWHEAV